MPPLYRILRTAIVLRLFVLRRQACLLCCALLSVDGSVSFGSIGRIGFSLFRTRLSTCALGRRCRDQETRAGTEERVAFHWELFLVRSFASACRGFRRILEEFSEPVTQDPVIIGSNRPVLKHGPRSLTYVRVEGNLNPEGVMKVISCYYRGSPPRRNSRP